MTQWDEDHKIIEGATPGPWYADKDHPNDIDWGVWPDDVAPLCDNLEHDDAAFIAAARTRWPAALERIAELEAGLREVVDELAQWGMGDMHYGPQQQESRVAEPVARARRLLSQDKPNG